jgi:AraC-like DNA-binding protein
MAFALPQSDREFLRGTRLVREIRFVETISELRQALRHGPNVALLCDVNTMSISAAEVVAGVDRCGRGPSRVIVRCAVTAGVGRRLLSLRDRVRVDEVSIRFSDRCGDDLLALESEVSGTMPLIEHLLRHAPPAISDIVVCALALGMRRVSVPALARACGLSIRTIEWRLAAAKSLRASRLLGSALCLHAAWRLELNGWGIKRVAAESGFASAAAFARFVRRHAMVSPVGLRQNGLDRLLETVSLSLHCGDVPNPGVRSQPQGPAPGPEKTVTPGPI